MDHEKTNHVTELAGRRFWERFQIDDSISFNGMQVLEIGCGFGDRCVEAAHLGASSVLGVDTSELSIQTANDRLSETPPEYAGKVRFHCGSLSSVPKDRKFDVIISEDAFEHVMDVDDLLQQMGSRLNESGVIYIGFGPLYHSPIGDHGWLRSELPLADLLHIPWGHLLFPNAAFRRLSKRIGRQIFQTKDWPYLDLNQLTLSEYKEKFEKSGLRVDQFRTNALFGPAGKLFGLIGRSQHFEKYFTLNIFCVLRRDRDTEF